jgi:hypothetical protein
VASVVAVAISLAHCAPRPSAPPATPSVPREQSHRIVVEGIAAVDLKFHFDAGFDQPQRVVDAATAAMQLLIAWFGPPVQRELKIVGTPWSYSHAQRAQPFSEEESRIVIEGRWLSLPSDFALEREVMAALARAHWRSIRHRDTSWRWFEDGLARYSASRLINEVLNPRFVPHRHVLRLFGGHVPYPLRALSWSRSRRDARPPLQWYPEFERTAGLGEPTSLPPSERAQRAAAGLLMQERVIGWSAMQQALAAFAARYQSREPAPRDLAEVLNEQRGVDSTQFLVDGLTSSVTVDYRLDGLTSGPLEDGTRFETKVRLGRTAAGLPIRIPVSVQFASGVDMRDSWDGDPMKSELIFESTSPAVSAGIDPDVMVVVDANRQNNGKVLQARPTSAVVKSGLRWFVWLQDCLLSYASLL